MMEILQFTGVVVMAIISLAMTIALPCLFITVVKDLLTGSADEPVLWFLAVITGSLTFLELVAILAGISKLLGVS